MKVEDLIVYGKKYLHSEHAKMLLANLLDLNSLELLNYLDLEVTSQIEQEYQKQVREVSKNNKPVQYVIGNVNFYGKIFKVNEKTLIPRFETEELVENTIFYINELFGLKPLKIIDLGTGSGCIGLTLKSKFPNAEVTLVDISKEALLVAKENALFHNLEVTIIENDMLNNLDMKYDCLISNPPYLKDSEEIDLLVRNNEPHLALFAGQDGLDCYRNILKNVKKNLNDKFLIALEIGESQGEDVKKLLIENLNDIKVIIKKDLQGRDRMVFAYK